MFTMMDSDWHKIPGHHYFDKSKQPKSGLAVPEGQDIKYSKVRQEYWRKVFQKHWDNCNKDNS